MEKWVEELMGIIKELSSGVAAIKERTEKNEQQLQAYKEWAGRGFPVPQIPSDKNMTPEDLKRVFGQYDYARQGKRLMDKFHHPKHVIESDEVRMEMAKFFVLFLRAAVFQDYEARQTYRDLYVKTTTDIGDTGNVFPIPDIVDSEILVFARELSVVMQYARIWDMTSDKQSFPTESGAASVAWGNTTAEGAPTADEVELDADELSSYASVRNTTLADARSDIVSWLTEAFAEAIGQEVDNSSFNGDGTSTYGFCSGILSAACGYSVTMASGSTAFSTLYDSVLSEMIGKLDGQKKIGARFWMNGSVLHFVRTLKDANGRPIFNETVGSPNSGTIYGYPYTEVIKCPSTSGANTAFIAFGNLRYFGVGRRLNLSTLQVDPYGLWTTNRTRFKIYQRWALKIALANGFARLLTHS